MDDIRSQFESLPNEIFIEIFEYLDARDLYRAFYNLNFRFNQIIKSLNELSLILSICDHDGIKDDAIFLPYIRTLIIKYKTDIKFYYYKNIRRLILFWLTYTKPYKLETIIFPYLEYLVINFKGSTKNFSINRLNETIFSNGFPCLKYCSLPKISIIQKTERWTILPSLRILKVGHIGLFTYIDILSTFIKEKYIGPISQAGILNEYLLCVPKLEYLSIHGTTYHMKDLRYLFEFDWFASIISFHLLSLQQFNFYLPIFRTKRKNKFMNEETFKQIEKYFQKMHHNRYQSRLIENRKNFTDLEYYDSSDLSD